MVSTYSTNPSTVTIISNSVVKPWLFTFVPQGTLVETQIPEIRFASSHCTYLSVHHRGPLIVCLVLSIILSFRAPTNQAALVFASVFVLVWVGSAIVTINAQLLGGTISFFQSVCVLGYCVFPMTVAALIVGVLRLTPISFVWLDIMILCLGFLWATRASSVFIATYIQKERRFLAVFPVFFFYIFLGWMILLF